MQSVRRVVLIGSNTVREAMRQRLYGVLLALALGLVAGVPFLSEFNFGAPELKFVADVGTGAMACVGAVLVVTATSQLFFSELEHRTVLMLLARPVARGEFVLGKYLGIIALVAGFCAVMTGLLAVVLWARETALMRQHPEAFDGMRAVSYLAVGAAGLLLWLKLAVLGAFTLVIVTFAQSQVFAAVLGFLVMAICQLQHLAQDAALRAGSPFTRAVAQGVAWVFPNFELFDIGTAWGHVGGVALYALAYIVSACAVAAASFANREI